jgi:hypothetical protein
MHEYGDWTLLGGLLLSSLDLYVLPFLQFLATVPRDSRRQHYRQAPS